jgi:hypothetical protein
MIDWAGALCQRQRGGVIVGAARRHGRQLVRSLMSPLYVRHGRADRHAQRDKLAAAQNCSRSPFRIRHDRA